MDEITLLINDMMGYFSGDAKRIQHFIKVHTLARQIARCENLELNTFYCLEVAAIVHDIGIKTAEEQFGKGVCGGILQQKLGPEPARRMLERLNFDSNVIDRVCFLIAHHHTYTNVEGLDWQILMEADFLVNAFEDELTKDAIIAFRTKVFKTVSGTGLLDKMYGLNYKREDIKVAKYWNEEIETMSKDDMKKLQSERLAAQVKHVYDNVPYYKNLMDEKGFTPDDIKGVEDLHKLPFLTKSDLRECYPYGMLATPLSECVRIQSTSGTTGKRVVAYYTQKDIDLWEDCCARAIVAAGGTKDDVCQVAYGYGLFTGGAGLNGGSHKVGCLTLPMSSGNTERQIQFMQDLNATILCCTPSYAAYIGETLHEMGLGPNDIKLKAGIFGAEPWTEEMRQSIEKSLGIKAYDIYGLTETSGPGVSFECAEQTGMHINEDHFIAEIIDPDTGEVLPEGSKGELVFTSITKEAFPLLRYRTRDICILSREKCSCGRTLVKMTKPMGRSDDMLIIKGVNVFPSQIETVLLKVAKATPNYLIVVDRVGNVDTFEIQVEISDEMFSDTVKSVEALEKKISNDIHQILGIRAKIRLMEPKSITRSEGKAVRVIDKRKLV